VGCADDGWNSIQLARERYGIDNVAANAETVKDNLQGARGSVLNYFVSD
jgi:hypothetical protein